MKSRFITYTIIIPIFVIAVGCTSPRIISVADNNFAEATYEQGIAILRSQKKHGVVVRLLTGRFSKETRELPALFVAFSNGGNERLEFSTRNVRCFSGDAKVGVYTYEELKKKIRRESALLALAVAMNSAGQSMQASMPQQSYTSGTASAYGSGGYAYGNYTAQTTTYNPAASAAAQAQINSNAMRQMEGIASSRNIQLNSLSSILRRNTVDPESIASGIVKLHAEDIRIGRLLKIVITIEGEEHEFIFEVSKT